MSCCPVCEASNGFLAEYAKAYSLRLLKCGRCSLVFTDPAQLDALAADVNYRVYGDEAYLDNWRDSLGHKRSQFAKVARWVARHQAGGRVLDVGCGPGLFLDIMREAGFDVVGVELNPRLGEFARAHFALEVHTGDLLTAMIPDSSLGLVTFIDVLEHVRNPVTVLSQARRLLHPGGKVAVKCPNIDGAMARWLGARWQYLIPDDHVLHFSPPSLTRLFSNAGFRLADLRTRLTLRDVLANLAFAAVQLKQDHGADVPQRSRLQGQYRRPLRNLAVSTIAFAGAVGTPFAWPLLTWAGRRKLGNEIWAIFEK